MRDMSGDAIPPETANPSVRSRGHGATSCGWPFWNSARLRIGTVTSPVRPPTMLQKRRYRDYHLVNPGGIRSGYLGKATREYRVELRGSVQLPLTHWIAGETEGERSIGVFPALFRFAHVRPTIFRLLEQVRLLANWSQKAEPSRSDGDANRLVTAM